jgi:hypothetical protein
VQAQVPVALGDRFQAAPERDVPRRAVEEAQQQRPQVETRTAGDDRQPAAPSDARDRRACQPGVVGG